MKAGLPIYKIDCFREVLEESGFRLTSRQHFENWYHLCTTKSIKRKVLILL